VTILECNFDEPLILATFKAKAANANIVLIPINSGQFEKLVKQDFCLVGK